MASNAQHSPRRKGKSKQYGSLQNLGTRERSESPRHTPRSSSSIRIRTPPPLKDTGECSSGNSPARQGSPKPCSRHVSNSSVMSLPDSPIHPPNLTHARRRIVSSESVASTLSLDSVNSLDSIKSSPDKYQPGLSPLECCLCCYPVMVSVLKHIPTPDVLALRRVSKMFKEHMEQNYTRHLLDICLVKDRNWLYRVYRPKAPSEKLEMDGVYQYQREFAFLKVAEEDAVLRHARVLYDSEVTFMVLRELAPYDAIPLFVSGGGRKVVDPDLMKKLCFRNPREFWDSLDFSENSAVCKAESTLPHNFFYHKINGVYLVKMLEHALTELVRVGLTRDFRFLRTLVIDGTGVTGDDLIHILQMYRLDEQLIGLSAIACPNVDLQVFLKMLEERRPRTLQWLKIYPSVEIPSMPFYYVSTSSGNDEHKHRTVNFHRCMTVQEHLDITLPLICSSNPNIEDKVTYAMRAEALMSYRQVLRGSMSSVWLQTQQVHMLKTMHPALKLIALCKARGVDLDFNFCASGIRCFTWKVEEERRKRGDPGGDLTLHTIIHRHTALGTHTLGSKLRQNRFGKKCGCCGCLESDPGPRDVNFLITILDLDPIWQVEGNKVVSTYRDAKISFEFVLGAQQVMKDVQEQEKCAALTMEVGGVMMARLLRTIERPYIYAPEGESGTSEMRVQVEKDYIPWPIGCGVGGICEHCDLNMTCWGCGDFYCQLCLNPPTMFNQWDQCPRNKRLLHYDTCVQRKHGPLCSTCLPKYTTQCSDCKHYFCNLCYPNGIKLESDHVMDDYKNLTKEDLQHHWEDLYIDTLADLSHEFLEPPEAWTVESKPDSGDDDTVDWGDLGTRYTTTVSEVVKQLRKIRERVRFEMEREKNGGGGVDVGEAMNDLEEVMFEKTAWEGYEENEDEEMHNQEEDGEGHEDNGGTRLILGKELGESGTSFHPYHEHDEDAHSVLSSNTSNASTPRPKVSKTSKTSKYKSQSTAPSTDFSPSPHGPPAEIFDFPTGKAYSGRPPHHPSFQSLLLKTLPRFPTYMAEQGLHPVAIYTTCGFCKKTVCGVCTKGRAHVFSEGWDWDRCGGCGEMMCGECCGNRCTLCRRGLCGECYERENKMRKTVVDALPCVGAFRLFRRRQRGWDVNNWKSLGVNSLGSSKGEVQEAGEYCFRCELRQFLAELRNMKKMSGEFYREGVDWEAGRQMVYEDWWAEWREPEKRLVGVMHGREEGGLVSGVKVGKDLGLLCEGVGGEFEVGEAGAAKEGWVPEGGELGIMTFGGV